MRITKFLIMMVAITLFSCNGETASNEVVNPVDHSTNTVKKEVAAHKGQAAVDDGVSAKNVLQVAASLEDFSTLVVAVKAAGVEDALANAGPLTVFAPMNSAFAKLPEGTVETLVKPENKSKLAFILTNHVAPSNYPIKQLTKEAKKGRDLYMASGKYLKVENKDGEIYVGGTKIIKSVKVSNGWIHVIDDVLVPAE